MLSRYSPNFLTRQDLQQKITQLQGEVEEHQRIGNSDRVDLIAMRISGLSYAISSNLLKYTDPSTGDTYSLSRVRLLGGMMSSPPAGSGPVTSSSPAVSGQETLEDAKKLVEEGGVLEKASKFGEALEKYQRSLVIRERLDPESLDVAASCNNIGGVYRLQGKLPEALKSFQRSLEIRERLAPGKIEVASCYNSIGIVYKSQGKLEEALKFYQRALALVERLVPGTVILGKAYNNIGTIYKEQGKLQEALEQYQRSLSISQNAEPDSLSVAINLHNIGCIYGEQGKSQEALEQYQRSLAIRERLAPGSLDVASSYSNLGETYKDQGKPEKALEHFQKALEIYERLAPNSMSVSESYSLIGNVYKMQGKLTEALDRYERSLAIRERLAPQSLFIANSYDDIGEAYTDQGKLEEALALHQKSLAIRELLAPGSLYLARTEYNLGLVYQSQGNLEEALASYQKSFAIRERDLIPKHPDLLKLGNSISQTSLALGDCANAVIFANKVIQNDPDYKYAYNTLGQALYKQNKFQEALAAFDQALRCDPGYADANVHRLAVIAAIAHSTNDFSRVQEEIGKAQRLEKTDYDQRKKAEMEALARASKQETKVELPKAEFELGSIAYLQKLEALCNQLQSRVAQHEQRLDAHDVRLSAVEERVDLLSGRVLKLEDSVGMIQKETARLDEKIASLPATDPLVEQLRFEKKKLVEREHHIKAFNKDTDQRHYFYALLSELEAAYVAAQAMQSGKFTEEKSETYGKAAEYAGSVLELIPCIGSIASKLVTSLGNLADTRANVKEKIEFMRLRSLAPTIDEFDQIAIRVAVKCTLENKSRLAVLAGSLVPKDWKANIGALAGGVEGLMTQFLKDNETQAKVLGRLDAFKVLAHLQEEAVAENYAAEESDDESSSPTRRRKHSVIRDKIVEEVFSTGVSHPAVAGPATTGAAATTSGAQAANAGPTSPVSSLQLNSLIGNCTAYLSEKSDSSREKTRAVQQLKNLLEKRAAGQTTSKDVLAYVDEEFNKSRNPIFTFLTKNRVQKFFEEAREVMVILK